jgi:hypothetical protein
MVAKLLCTLAFSHPALDDGSGSVAYSIDQFASSTARIDVGSSHGDK